MLPLHDHVVLLAPAADVHSHPVYTCLQLPRRNLAKITTAFLPGRRRRSEVCFF